MGIAKGATHSSVRKNDSKTSKYLYKALSTSKEDAKRVTLLVVNYFYSLQFLLRLFYRRGGWD